MPINLRVNILTKETDQLFDNETFEMKTTHMNALGSSWCSS